MQPDQYAEWLKKQQAAAETLHDYAIKCDDEEARAGYRREINVLKAALQHYEESGPFLSVGEVREKLLDSFADTGARGRLRDAAVGDWAVLTFVDAFIDSLLPLRAGDRVGADACERPSQQAGGVKEHLPVSADSVTDMSAGEREKAEKEIRALTSPQGVIDLLDRLVQAIAPVAEDGGSAEQIEALNEVFVDLCFVSHWFSSVDSATTSTQQGGEGDGG